MNREELEYHLDTDVANYGKRYKANPDSRWNTPEFAALAVDAVRKLQVLQSTKAFWAKSGATFSRDMKIIAKTTDKDFEDFQFNIQKAALQNVPITALISQARAQGAEAAQTTLQRVLSHAATTVFFGRCPDNVLAHGPGDERKVWTVLFFLYRELCRHVSRADSGHRAGRLRAAGSPPSQHFAGFASYAHIP